MIISINNDAEAIQFENLLASVINYLNHKALESPRYFSSRAGRLLEEDVYQALTELAIGTPFADTIKPVGGQKFPDIVVKNYYGVEVKTTTQNHWKCTGNSVLEGTRVEGVERIYLFFGKLAPPVQFRYAKYENCLNGIVITHSPRYSIDMDTTAQGTIFNKIGIPYNELRSLEQPITPFKKYYKNQMAPGDDVWWMDNELNDASASGAIVKLWSNLPFDRKEKIRIEALGLFPEMFGGNSQRKFLQIPAWLVARHGVVNKNVRDIFTAGGQKVLTIDGMDYPAVPAIFAKAYERTKAIFEFLETVDPLDLERYWGMETEPFNTKKTWLALVHNHSHSQLAPLGLDIYKIMGVVRK